MQLVFFLVLWLRQLCHFLFDGISDVFSAYFTSYHTVKMGCGKFAFFSWF
jgi:hypothetical protein